MNTYLFDGVWRFKVLGVEKGANDTKYRVRVQVRNGTSVQQNNLRLTGFASHVNLVMSDESTHPWDTFTDHDWWSFMDSSLPPGGAANHTMTFTLPKADFEGTATPAKLLVEVDPKPFAGHGKPFHYPVHDPSFRVKLDCGAAL